MRALAIAIPLTLFVSLAHAQPPPTAEVIMARVAANQDSSEADRLHYLYLQHARVASHKGGTLMCEEITDIRITPLEHGSQQTLVNLNGRLRRKGAYVSYNQLPPGAATDKDTVDVGDEDLSISIDSDNEADRDMVEHMRNNFINNKSKDGIASNLFPLTSGRQAEYAFHLLGREHLNGRDVFHLTFAPKDKSEFGWKGDAYIDTEAFQPVVVRTAMSRQIPFAVRTLLGTSLPGLGFNVVYAPQPDGVWFPVSFGTEFKIRVLFFYRRNITLNAENHDFVRTHVTSHIVENTAPAATPPN